MRNIIILLVVLAVACPSTANAIVGFAVGGKVGYADYGGDVLPESGDLGGSIYYGLVVELTTLPVVDFELHANYFTKDFSYTYDFGGIPYAADFEFQDFHVLALLKKNLIRVPTSPLSLYVGGGIGYHIMSTEVALAMAGAGFDPLLAEDPLSLAGDVGRMSVDGLVGLKLSAAAMPLAVFAESRYGVIFTDAEIRTLQVEGGVMLNF